MLPEVLPSLKLMDCGSIRSGQSFRKAPIEDSQSRCFSIQTKDLLPIGCISQELTPISTINEKPKPNVEAGDILIIESSTKELDQLLQQAKLELPKTIVILILPLTKIFLLNFG